jgi:diguanylate cyclase (GGDEF)-like protein
MRRLLAPLLLAPGVALAAPALNPQLEQQLDQLVLVAMHDPAQALSDLRAIAETPDARNQGVRVRFTEGRIRLQSGEITAVTRLITELTDPTDPLPAQVLRSALFVREGQLAAAAQSAQAVRDRLGNSCEISHAGGTAPVTVPRDCDVTAALITLALLEQDQLNRGALPKAAELANARLALARAAQRSYDIVLSLSDMALLDVARDKPAEALQAVQQAHHEAGEDPLMLAQAKAYEAVLHNRTGNRPAQLQALNEGLTLAREAGVSSFVARAQTNLADYYMQEHQPARALALLDEALPTLLRLNDQFRERTVRHNLSVTLIRLHRFPEARKESAKVEELRRGQPDTTQRIRELRELDQAWADAGQPKEAIALFHAERQLTEEANRSNREALLAELKVKYDSASKQRALDLLVRDKSIKDRQLDNRTLLREVGLAMGALLSLATMLGVVMVRKARAAQKALKAKEALLRAQSERDPLTDLANRRHFLAVMERQPAAQFQGALLMVDIDHFKHVNDEHGHASGDAVICEVARRLSGAVRGGDLVVRWGGEEFLVFAPVSSNDQLETLAERMLESVGRLPVITPDGPLRVTASAGFARFPLGANLNLHWEQAVNWVDLALYNAKARGRNRAIGIGTVNVNDAASLARVEADIEAASAAGLVSLKEVAGPT